MIDLPSDLKAFASLLDAQTQPAREAFQYCLCLMIVESGKMQLKDKFAGETSPICVFEAITGELFSVPRPLMSQEEEAELIAELQNILKDEGML